MSLRRKIISVAAAVLITMGASAQTAFATSPEQAASFLTKLADSTVTVLQSQETALDVREAKIRALLHDNFDFYRIGRYVMGNAWKSATKAQQTEFLSLFRENVLRTYSRRLGGYVGQTFKIVGSTPAWQERRSGKDRYYTPERSSN
jgi:phospholipid transport system substrate-binding protein